MEYILLLILVGIGICFAILIVFNLEYVSWFLSLVWKYVGILFAELIEYALELVDKCKKSKKNYGTMSTDEFMKTRDSETYVKATNTYTDFHNYSSTQSQNNVNELERLWRAAQLGPYSQDIHDDGGLLGRVISGSLGSVASNCTPNSQIASNCTSANYAPSGMHNMAMGTAAFMGTYASEVEKLKVEKLKVESELEKYKLQLEMEQLKIEKLKREINDLRSLE